MEQSTPKSKPTALKIIGYIALGILAILLWQVTLTVLPFVGIWYLWKRHKNKKTAVPNSDTTVVESKKPKMSKKKKWIIGGVVAVFVLAAISVLNSPSNNGMPTDQQAEIVSKSFVRTQLKYPDDAKFAGIMDGRATVVVTNNRYKVEHWVKAPNDFGQMQKMNYYIVMEYNGGEALDPQNWTVTSFNMK